MQVRLTFDSSILQVSYALCVNARAMTPGARQDHQRGPAVPP